MTPLHDIACFYDVGFGAWAVSRKTPIYFISYGILCYLVVSNSIARYCVVGFGAQAVSRKTPILPPKKTH